MITLNPTQLTLQAHLKAEAEKLIAWTKEAPSRYAFVNEYDDEEMVELTQRGIHTIEDHEREELINVLWDVYKDAYGVRPRHLNIDAMTMTELQFDIDAAQGHMRAEQEYNDKMAQLELEVNLRTEERIEELTNGHNLTTNLGVLLPLTTT
jgi:hypothetical protein|tara:strand:- start:589 stop:1041 length:453 start_codon:yes stop_codon:yes gene_type:complete